MKKNYEKSRYVITSLLIALVSAGIFFGCDKTIHEDEIKMLDPLSVDETGGSWKPIVISSPSNFIIPEPTETTSSEYLAELEELKSIRSNLTDKQKDIVKYWSAGGVLRWNEIVRELIAKYNLAPASNPDGTYSSPNALEPTKYPEFPFANPPYAARAYALLTVAQYDALVGAWYHKYQYNRLAPYKVDNSVTTDLVSSDLPSYPSEDAVIASASLEVLKFMFPGDIEFLTEKAQEHMNARLWSGANVKSDIQAGDVLGKAIAAEIIAHGKEDGMKTAGKWSQELQGAAEIRAKNNFKMAWKSVEIPARPPMLPNYGNVKNWLFDEATRVAIRPPAPPAIGTPEFEKDVAELRHYTKNITREQFRIVSFWADGTGTYTPAGHWNQIATELIVKKRFNELRTARAYALLNMALVDAGISCWDAKYFYYYARPSNVDSKIKTATGLPNFPSYTSGHATFSGAAATVLSYLFPDSADQLMSMAREAADSRVYAGIHFRFDSTEGLKSGNTIGGFAVEKGKADGSSQ